MLLEVFTNTMVGNHENMRVVDVSGQIIIFHQPRLP